MVDFLKYRKLYFLISGAIFIFCLISFLFFPLKLGIDLRGGAILEIEYKKERPEIQKIKESLEKIGLKEYSLQLVGEKGITIRTKEIDEKTYREILDFVGKNIEEKSFELVGSVVGKELREKAKAMIFLVFLLIFVYVFFAFKEVSKLIKPWCYCLSIFFCLLQNVLLPLGIFSILGNFFEISITIPVLVAILTIFGYSINDIIVVFDRIRENLKKKKLSFEDALNFSINQTLSRQINTSLTTLFPLIFIFFFGPEALKLFSFSLIIGICGGLYSSIFLASSILYSLKNLTFSKKEGKI